MKMKRAAYAVLFFLAGILFPILIWVALFVAIREPLLQAMRRVAWAALGLLTGIFFPILIWVGFGVAAKHWIQERMLERQPGRTVGEILASAGLRVESGAELLALALFVKQPMSEIRELLARAELGYSA